MTPSCRRCIWEAGGSNQLPPEPIRSKEIAVGHAKMNNQKEISAVPNNQNPLSSAISSALILLAGVGGLALVVWVTIVMLDLKHLNTSGFTLP